ncbi:hypothetical protein OAH18_01285 [bacterium]|nr:hypothetical protein [bacterium]
MAETDLSSASAIIDASVVYGASRWYRGMHSRSDWEFAHKYNAIVDKQSFVELLHNLILYDKILLDRSSISTIGSEIRLLFSRVNASAGFKLLATAKLTDARSIQPLAETTCSHLHELLTAGIRTKEEFETLEIPWYYKQQGHQEYEVFSDIAVSIGLPDSLIPTALYAFRGLCYSGYANGLAERRGRVCAYLASPGRMQILSRLLDANDLASARFAKTGYRDLVTHLGLPRGGYDFKHLKSLAASQLSALHFEVSNSSPREALGFALDLRKSDAAMSVRAEWSKRIWAESRSCSVGRQSDQIVTGSHIEGDLTMIHIHGASLN